MSSQFIPNEPFDRIFLLKGIDERRTKSGKPYLALILGTSEGAWDARVWDMGTSSLPGLVEGDPVQAKGSVQLYQEKTQLILQEISRVDKPVDPRSIYPATSASEEQLRRDFNFFAGDIESPALKTLMEIMLKDKTVSKSFFTCPAAITMHHARIGGLAEHSLNVCRLALATTAAAPWLDKDLLMVGALLHDIGKILEYEVAGDFRFTLDGKFLGHIIQGHSLVEKWIRQIPDFPERLALDVLHIILSHHGQLEYGSPKTPATAEALVINFADDLDAKLDMVKTAGEEPGTEEAFVRGLRRSFLYRSPSTLRQSSGQAEQVQGTRYKGKDEEESPERESGREGEGEEKPPDGEEKPPEGESGRGGEGEKNRETEKSRHGRDRLRNEETAKEDTDPRKHGSTGKKAKEGQEELF